MGMTAILFAGAASIGSSITAGQQQAKSIKRQGEYNAQIAEQQASVIQEQKKISEYQFNRQAARMRGSIAAQAAGKGFKMSGSPLAILIDNETQMQYDQAINNYNLDVNANFARSSAGATRMEAAQRASLARNQGYSNAFSTALSTASAASSFKSNVPTKTPSRTMYGNTYKP